MNKRQLRLLAFVTLVCFVIISIKDKEDNPEPEPKPKPKPKPKPRPGKGQLLCHKIPPEFTSPFRKFLESVDKGHPNEVVTTYLILKRTSARYITEENPDGVRYIAENYGDITRSKARKLTVGDVSRAAYKRDGDWIPCILALKGKNLARTPAAGDKKRSQIWKRIQKGKKRKKK